MTKTILITGAGSGIGKDASFALAARGHRVLATTQTQAQAEALAHDSQHKGIHLEAFKLDITLDADRKLIEPFAIDVLVNNAGMGESGSLAEVDMQRVRNIFEVNLFFHTGAHPTCIARHDSTRKRNCLAGEFYRWQSSHALSHALQHEQICPISSGGRPAR